MALLDEWRRRSTWMTDAADPRRRAAEALYGAMIEARRDGGDAVVIDALDMLGAHPGQHRYRRAATAIRSLAPGREPIDDAHALQRIMKFAPARRRDAVGVIARDVAGGDDASEKQVHAAKCRLHRKLKMKDI
jgi:hypothetical protein